MALIIYTSLDNSPLFLIDNKQLNNHKSYGMRGFFLIKACSCSMLLNIFKLINLK